MSTLQDPGLESTLVDESMLVGIDDLCRICAIEKSHVVEFVEEGVLEVEVHDGGAWHFRGGALRRARLAMRLQRDLELNLVGVALALDLMDEIQHLRRAIRAGR